MMEYLFSGYGMAGLAVVFVVLFFVFTKVMGFIWKIVMTAVVLGGGYLYLQYGMS